MCLLSRKKLRGVKQPNRGQKIFRKREFSNHDWSWRLRSWRWNRKAGNFVWWIKKERTSLWHQSPLIPSFLLPELTTTIHDSVAIRKESIHEPSLHTIERKSPSFGISPRLSEKQNTHPWIPCLFCPFEQSVDSMGCQRRIELQRDSRDGMPSRELYFLLLAKASRMSEEELSGYCSYFGTAGSSKRRNGIWYKNQMFKNCWHQLLKI